MDNLSDSARTYLEDRMKEACVRFSKSFGMTRRFVFEGVAGEVPIFFVLVEQGGDQLVASVWTEAHRAGFDAKAMCDVAFEPQRRAVREQMKRR